MLPKLVESPKAFGEILMQRQDQIGAACPDHINVARVVTFMNLAIAGNPKLRNCTRLSVLKSLVECVTLGLEPNTPLNHAWLIPYGNECKFQVGYQGLIALAYRSDRIDTIVAEPVFGSEPFVHEKGLKPIIEHQPDYDIDRTEHTLKYVYAYAYLKGSTHPIYVVMPMKELETYRARSKAKNAGPWGTDPIWMYKKTAIIQVCKMLPKSADDQQLHQAIAADQTGKTYSMNDVVDLDGVDPAPVEPKELTPEEQEAQNQKEYDEAMQAEKDKENGTNKS